MIAAAAWAGSIPTWLLLFFGLVIAYRVSKGGGGSAVSELSKANEVLDKRLHQQGGEIRDLRVENAELKAKTDFALALAPLMEWSGNHETRAQERHEHTMVILELIASKLGKDLNGH